MNKILFIFPPKEKASSDYYFRAKQEIEILSKKYDVKIIKSVSKTDSSMDKKNFLYRFIKLIMMLPRILTETRKSDTIFIFNSPFWYFLVPLAKLYKKKIILDHFTTSLYNHELDNNPIKYFFSFLDYFIYNNFDLVITHTERMKNLLLARYKIDKTKIKVTYSCVNPNFFKKVKTDMKSRYKLNHKKVVMYHGFFHPYHGVSVILDVARKFKDSTVVFFIIGQNIKKDLFTKTYKFKNVINIGPQEYIKLPKFLSIADIWIGALGKGIQGERALSSNMIAAMSMGIPTIVGDCPENKRIIQDGINGFIIPRNNPRKLADKIQQVLSFENKSLIGKEARKTIIKNFSVKLMEKKLLKIIDDIN